MKLFSRGFLDLFNLNKKIIILNVVLILEINAFDVKGFFLFYVLLG